MFIWEGLAGLALCIAMAIITVFQRIFHVRKELTKPVTDPL